MFPNFSLGRCHCPVGETRQSAPGERLFLAAWLFALAGWLPAIVGDWWLLAISGICFCASVWRALRSDIREQKEWAAREAAATAAQRPLRHLAAAEREVLARHGRTVS